MMQLSTFVSQLPLLQTLFFILSFSTLIWLVTAFMSLKRMLTGINGSCKNGSFEARKSCRLPKLSVVVPARNEQKYIGRCVNSLLAQNYPDIEILVVDDNSSDMTSDILNSIKDPKLRVVCIKRLPGGWAGKTWACQVGLYCSTGELILFTDADTNFFDKDALLNTIVEMEKNSYKIVTGMPLLELSDFYSKMVMPLLNLFIDCFDGIFNASENKVIGSFFLVRRDVLKSINGFNKVKNSFQEDTDIGIEFGESNIKVKRVKLNNMVSAVWSRDYQTLKHGIRRIVAYDFQRKKKGFVIPYLFVFTLVLIPYVLLLYNSMSYWTNNNEINYLLLLWNSILCLIPIFGYLVVNSLKHKSQAFFSLMVFPASCFIIFSFTTNVVRFVIHPSNREIIWKG